MRVLVRLIITLVSLAAAALGALLVIEVIWALLRPDDPGLLIPWSSLRASLSVTAWNETPVFVTAGLVTLAGLLLLVLTFRAGHKEIRLHDAAPEVTVTTDRRSLARVVGHRVREQDGIASADVVAGQNKVRVRATSAYSTVDDLPDRISEVVRDSVDELPLQSSIQISVTVSAPKESP